MPNHKDLAGDDLHPPGPHGHLPADEFKIGFKVQMAGGTLALLDGVGVYLRLSTTEDSTYYEYWRHGFTVDDSPSYPNMFYPQVGRYLLTGTVVVYSHETNTLRTWYALDGDGEVVYLTIPPNTGAHACSFSAIVERPKPGFPGAVFYVRVDGGNTLLADSYWTGQYVGPATSI